MSHTHAREGLARGMAPELICATCPWDQFCVEPPSMSKADVDRIMSHAEQQDKHNALTDPHAFPTAQLLSALVTGGRETAGQLCPVFALRLRGPDGHTIATGLRSMMRAWRDDEGAAPERAKAAGVGQ